MLIEVFDEAADEEYRISSGTFKDAEKVLNILNSHNDMPQDWVMVTPSIDNTIVIDIRNEENTGTIVFECCQGGDICVIASHRNKYEMTSKCKTFKSIQDVPKDIFCSASVGNIYEVMDNITEKPSVWVFKK